MFGQVPAFHATLNLIGRYTKIRHGILQVYKVFVYHISYYVSLAQEGTSSLEQIFSSLVIRFSYKLNWNYI